MTGWKKFSTLVELERPLIQFQKELVEGGNALQELLVVAHPNVDAVLNAIESILNQLDEEGISKTWVTAHVCVGKKEQTHCEQTCLSGKSIYILSFDNYAYVHVILKLLIALR